MRFSPGNAQHAGARSEQQDAFGFSDPNNAAFVAHAGVAAVVADGMGGLAHGGDASKTAVQVFLDAYAIKTQTEPIPDALVRSIRRANQAVADLARDKGDKNHLGTTLAAMVMHEEWLYWVSAGDSRVYVYRDGRVTRVTADHTYAADLDVDVTRGKITREQALHHPERDSLTSYLGLDQLPKVERSLRPFPLKVGDCALICTDGLYRSLSDDEIAATLGRDAHNSCESLIESALAKKNPRQDNVTVVALRCEADRAPRLPPGVKIAGIAAAAVLTALGGALLVWRSVTPEVQFTVDPASVSPGQTATLHWSVKRGSVSITPPPGNAPLERTGSLAVSPPAKTIYTLNANGWFRIVSKAVTVDVVAPIVTSVPTEVANSRPAAAKPASAEPVIRSFTAQPGSVEPDGEVTLSWTVGDAKSVEISPETGCAPLKWKGNCVIRPQETTVYTLTAKGAGKSTSKSVRVKVEPET
jgi:protein phosphatase